MGLYNLLQKTTQKFVLVKKIYSVWSEWTEYTECSETCIGGTQKRTRECSVPDKCPGKDIEAKKCPVPERKRNNYSCI